MDTAPPSRPRSARQSTHQSAPPAAPVGVGTYAYFWRSSDRVPQPMGLEEMLDDAAAGGAGVFQICDHPQVEAFDAARLVALRERAAGHGIVLELGTRGTSPDHLRRYLELARALGAGLVRSMWTSGADRPDAAETERRLREVLPAYEDRGAVLALETYEQVRTADLVTLVETVASDSLGICLDPANSVANLELPQDVTARCAPYVRNWHVKDFAFTRQDGWVGFSLVGAALGTGLLDYDGMRATLRPAERGISRIAEHWLPWQGDPATTTRIETEWTAITLDRLRSTSHD